jgi:L-rhamnose-H+ transport protein
MSLWSGIVITVIAGLIMGTSPWPLKLMRRYQYEHFAFLSMLLALVVLPWSITLACCPHPLTALLEVDVKVLLTANLFALCWGIAQVLALQCFLRIGVSLTYGILCSIGAAVGVILPMVVKASGVFQNAPSLFSSTGAVVLAGTALMVVGVALAAQAGVERERLRAGLPANTDRPRGALIVGLVMVVLAGVLSVGWGCAFNYSQAAIIERMRAHGAADFPASVAVWAVALLGAALPNVLYPALLMTRNKSWGVLVSRPSDLVLSLIYGFLFFVPSPLLSEGSLRLGALGASVGWGLVQGTLILGGQFLGFASGEWRGVYGTPRTRIRAAIVTLIIAMVILASAKWAADRMAVSQPGLGEAETNSVLLRK